MKNESAPDSVSHGTLLRSISPPPKAAHNDLTLCSAFAQRPVVIRFVTQSHLSSGKSRSLRVAFVPIVIFPRSFPRQSDRARASNSSARTSDDPNLALQTFTHDEPV